MGGNTQRKRDDRIDTMKGFHAIQVLNDDTPMHLRHSNKSNYGRRDTPRSTDYRAPVFWGIFCAMVVIFFFNQV